MITFYLNGEKNTSPEALSLSDLLKQQAYDETTIAVAINQTFTPRQTYAKTPIQENDHIEIVSAMQGG